MTGKLPRLPDAQDVSANDDHLPVPALRRLVAILIADVAGYTRLMERDDAGTLARLRDIRQRLIDPALRRHGGRVVKTGGDSMLVEFGSADAALRCAIEVQRAMRDLNRGAAEDDRIEFRMGINVGDIIVDGDEIAGDGINVAARLEALSSPGAICISGAVHEQVHGDVGARFDDIGDQQVRNLMRPIRVYRVTVGPTAAHADPAAGPPGIGVSPSGPHTGGALTSLRAVPPRVRWIGAAATVGAVVLSLWLVERGGGPPAVAAPPPLSIAILPFAAPSGTAEDRAVAQALTQDLTTGLGAWHQASVTTHGMVVARLAGGGDARALGRDLNVRYVVEGDVRREGDALVISSQMMDVASGRQVWGERLRYDSVQPSAGKTVPRLQLTRRLHIALEAAEIQRVGAQPTATGPMELVLRGEAVERGTGGAQIVREARALYAAALKLDPGFEPALEALANSYDDELEDNEAVDRAATMNEMDRMTSRAIALDRMEAGAWISRASFLQWQGRFGEALSASEQARLLDPARRGSYLGHAWSLIRVGRPADALGSIDMARALDPLDPGSPDHFACKAYLLLGRYGEAVGACERAATVIHGWINQLYLCAAYAMNGRRRASDRVLQRAAEGKAGLHGRALSRAVCDVAAGVLRSGRRASGARAGTRGHPGTVKRVRRAGAPRGQSRRISAIAATIIPTKNTNVHPAIDRPRNTQAFSAHSPVPFSTRVKTSSHGIDSIMYDRPMPQAGTWSFGSACSQTCRPARPAPAPATSSVSSA